jgi:hypothetical protein
LSKERWTETGRRITFTDVKPDGQVNTPPNYTRRMIGVFAGQVMLIAAWFVWSDCRNVGRCHGTLAVNVR